MNFRNKESASAFKNVRLSKNVYNVSLPHREALLAELGVAVREDGGSVGVFPAMMVRTLKRVD